MTIPSVGPSFGFVALGCMDRASLAQGLSLFTRSALAMASVSTIALLMACAIVAGRAAFRRNPSSVTSENPGDSRWLAAIWLVTLFVAVFSAKLCLMHENAVTTPFWDQWDAEARLLYVPFNSCRLTWRQMFALHNEHRVFFTRLLDLALLSVNGQWDPRLQQVVNAAMHSLTACLVAIALWVANDRRRVDFFAVVCGATFALPFSWENTLVGFQSAFYFQLLFSILAIWLATISRVGSAGWCLGWACAVCGLVSAAGGMVTPLAIAGIGALNFAGDGQKKREALITSGIAAIVLGLGLALKSPPVQGHAFLKADTLAGFVLALSRNLAWPWVEHPSWSVVQWLPVATLFLAVFFRREARTTLATFVLGLSLWVVLQAGAIAFGRGAGAPMPAPRYQDFLSLGFAANAAALLAGIEWAGARTTVRRMTIGATAAWLVYGGVGMERLTQQTLVDLSGWHARWLAHRDNVRQFIMTDNVAEFTSKRPLIDLPYPDPIALAGMLQDEKIRSILPAAIRRPVRVEPRLITNQAFVSEGTYPTTPRDPLRRAWGSYTAEGNTAQGQFESDLLAACPRGSYLEFQIAGYLGVEHQSLAVRDVRLRHETEVRPDYVSKDAWSQVLIPCPQRPYTIVAVDERPDSWFSFREPVEVGGASTVAESLIMHSSELFYVGLGLALVAARCT